MSQMRKDVFTGRWVIMAETNTVRPTDFQFQAIHERRRLLPILRD